MGDGRGDMRERGGEGDEESLRSELSSGRRRKEIVSVARRRLLSRPRRGTRSPPLEWWNDFPGSKAERTRKFLAQIPSPNVRRYY
jgi:hypothetical protein